MEKRLVIGIDPGLSGAIVKATEVREGYRTHLEDVTSVDMPESLQELRDFCKELSASVIPVTVYLEKVGGYMPGNSGPAAVTFARHVGNLEQCLVDHYLSYEFVLPNAWMKVFGVPTFTGTKAQQKAARKNWIMAKVNQLYPRPPAGRRRTGWTKDDADAMGLLHSCTVIGIRKGT